MFDPLVPYNELPFVSDIVLDMTPELIDLREEARVSIELLNYALKSLPNTQDLLDTLAMQEARVSSHVENIRTTNDDLLRAVAFKNFTVETKAISNYKDALVKGFDLLDFDGYRDFEGAMKNILYLGMPNTAQAVLCKEKQKKKDKQERQKGNE